MRLNCRLVHILQINTNFLLHEFEVIPYIDPFLFSYTLQLNNAGICSRVTTKISF